VEIRQDPARASKEESYLHGTVIKWGSVARPKVTMLFIPYWLIILLCGCTGYALDRRRTRVLIPGQYCGTCGYDLRATPARCPECGTATQQPHVQ
jgi:hypothetical protein